MAFKAKLYDVKGKGTGEVTLPDAVFNVRPRRHLLFDQVTAELASRRQGTAKTKERAEVRGGGRKPYKQKGTGSARRGTNRSPLMPGGGRTFGPQPRDYAYQLPRQVRAEALRVALSEKGREGKVLVFENFDLKAPKTAPMTELLEKLEVRKALVVDNANPKLERSVRNIPNVKYAESRGMTVFDLMKYEHLLLSSAALRSIEEGLSR